MALERYRNAKDAADVNLIPVMNLFVVLIPFLLLCAAFYHVAIIPTSLPSQGIPSDNVEGNPRQVTVNVQLNETELVISASNPILDPEQLAALSLTMTRTEDGFDTEKFERALFHIKQLYPESDTIVLLPGTGIVYSDVVVVLDSARELVTDEGTENEKRVPLFPVVVLSRKV